MKLCKELDEMEWRTEMIEKRMQDMASSSVMMNRVLLSTQEAIEDLRYFSFTHKIELKPFNSMAFQTHGQELIKQARLLAI